MNTLTKESTSVKKITPEDLRKMREKDNKLVKGVFRCFDPKGGCIKFSYKKYRGDSVRTYNLIDEKVYELPLMVARHLNNECYYKEHIHVLDENGTPIVADGKKRHRCSFENLDFYN